MDQTLINWVFAGGGAAFGWVLKVIWDAIQELKRDMRQIERDLPEVYVRRDDFKDAVKEIKDDMKAGFSSVDRTLGLIFKKLDDKENR
jgi:hypothetical protein